MAMIQQRRMPGTTLLPGVTGITSNHSCTMEQSKMLSVMFYYLSLILNNMSEGVDRDYLINAFGDPCNYLSVSDQEIMSWELDLVKQIAESYLGQELPEPEDLVNGNAKAVWCNLNGRVLNIALIILLLEIIVGLVSAINELREQ